MKKLFYSILTIAFIALFAACNPLVNNLPSGKVITADQIQATVTPVVVNGQNSNKVMVHCTSPVLCQWTDGILTYVSNDTAMILFTTGNVDVTLNALTAAGDTLTKTYQVQIDDMTYPVDPHWALFTGDGSKTWVWATDIPAGWGTTGVGAGMVYGNGGYLANNAPAWWANGESALAGWNVANDQMTFDLNGGANFTLITGNNQTQTDGSAKGLPAGTYKGSFKFDFTQTVATSSPPGATGGNDWSIGVLNLTGAATVSLGFQPNFGATPIYSYNILYLDDNVMILAAPEPGVTAAWGTCWYWVFKKQGYTF